jgi:general secretion pathway protein A
LEGNNHTRTAFLFNPKLTVTDFIQYILKDLGVEIQGQTKGECLHNLHQYLLDAYQRSERVVLIVDEAHGLSGELLEEIRLLSNLETSRSKLLQIVLVGQPELNETLSQSGFRQLRQRINMRHHLHPLSEKETKEYIEKRLRIAGTRGSLFTGRAIKEIYLQSGGIPRLINILCDNSLLNGYAQDQKVVDEKSVIESAKDLGLYQTSKTRVVWKWALATILILGFGLLLTQIDLMGYLTDLCQKIFQRVEHTGDLISELLKKI